MSKYRYRLPIALVTIFLTAGHAGAQAQPNTPSTLSSIERFSGRLTMLRGTPAIAVQYNVWGLAPGTNVAGLPLKSKGYQIYELRAGKLTTIIDGKQEDRRQGEFWVVRPDQSIILRTYDDDVVIHTILVSTQ
jgi:hypothetical protein